MWQDKISALKYFLLGGAMLGQQQSNIRHPLKLLKRKHVKTT